MKTVLQVLAALVLMPIAASAQTTYQDQGRSSVSIKKNADGQTEITTTNVNFEVARLYSSEVPETFLLKKTLTETSFDNVDGSTSKLTVEARTAGRSDFDRIAWTLKEDAHGASFDGQDLYLTRLDGCCGTAAAYRAYNIRNGKLIAAYDGNQGTAEGAVTTPFVIEVPNVYPGLKRFIGVISGDAARDFEAADRNGQTKLATLTYASLDGALQIVDVYGIVPEGWGVSTSSEIVDLAGRNEGYANRLTLWSSDSITDPVQAFAGFGIKLTFSTEDSQDVLIPVKNDRLNVNAATLPTGYSLVIR
ncbi:MAG: hypothetical protein KF789_04440 [Bdellovibrionaceae bacterium]|nr:hypothetical protein [Pseudobdellovibrionaceae bacterium]